MLTFHRWRSRAVFSDLMKKDRTAWPCNRGKPAAAWLGTSQWHRAAAQAASTRRSIKYTDMSADYLFLPVLAFEILDPISHSAIVFINESGCYLSFLSVDTRKRSFLFQCISMALHCFNAITFQGIFLPDWDLDKSWSVYFLLSPDNFCSKSLGEISIEGIKMFTNKYMYNIEA